MNKFYQGIYNGVEEIKTMGNNTELKFTDLLAALGEAGKRLSEIEASEGAAGNLSICVREPLELPDSFPLVSDMELPVPVPGLEGATFIVTGSGRRLREIANSPESNLGCLVVQEGGSTARMYTSPQRRFERVTSEFNSHLAVHYDQMRESGGDFHAIVHAQPLHLTYLSQIPRYQDEKYFNTHLLRWQPEAIINFSEGIGCIPFNVPGSPELMSANVESLRAHRMVIWAKHGVMSRSNTSIMRAVDLVEYAEAAARYEYLNLNVGEIGEGLSTDEIHAICNYWNIHQNIF